MVIIRSNSKGFIHVKSLLSIVAVAAFAGAAVAAPQSGSQAPAKPAPKPPPAKVAAAPVCPITGEKVADTKTAEKSSFKGKTYYFCCAGCKPMFDKNPAKYVKAEPAKPAKASDPKKKV
jgi:YHS domain-containing protein